MPTPVGLPVCGYIPESIMATYNSRSKAIGRILDTW